MRLLTLTCIRLCVCKRAFFLFLSLSLRFAINLYCISLWVVVAKKHWLLLCPVCQCVVVYNNNNNNISEAKKSQNIKFFI